MIKKEFRLITVLFGVVAVILISLLYFTGFQRNIMYGVVIILIFSILILVFTVLIVTVIQKEVLQKQDIIFNDLYGFPLLLSNLGTVTTGLILLCLPLEVDNIYVKSFSIFLLLFLGLEIVSFLRFLYVNLKIQK